MYKTKGKRVDKRQETFRENYIFHVVKTAVIMTRTSSRHSCMRVSDILTLYDRSITIVRKKGDSLETECLTNYQSSVLKVYGFL